MTSFSNYMIQQGLEGYKVNIKHLVCTIAILCIVGSEQIKARSAFLILDHRSIESDSRPSETSGNVALCELDLPTERRRYVLIFSLDGLRDYAGSTTIRLDTTDHLAYQGDIYLLRYQSPTAGTHVLIFCAQEDGTLAINRTICSSQGSLNATPWDTPSWGDKLNTIFAGNMSTLRRPSELQCYNILSLLDLSWSHKKVEMMISRR